jgi:hypothetical protein
MTAHATLDVDATMFAQHSRDALLLLIRATSRHPLEYAKHYR